MAFFPDVAPGDEFKPNALLSNNVRHLINSMNGFASKPIYATKGMIRIQVYNNSKSIMSAGMAVNFSKKGSIYDNAIPAEPLTDTSKPWGVLINELGEHGIGSCVVCGPVTVKISGTGDYATPSKTNPTVFSRGAIGSPVLFADDKTGVILLGTIAQDIYNGPFAISYNPDTKLLKIETGYLNRNGEWLVVEPTEIAPITGSICVCTNLDEEGNWTKPEIKIAEPSQFAFPIGDCKLEGETVSFSSYRVPVAIFLVSDICSTTA